MTDDDCGCGKPSTPPLGKPRPGIADAARPSAIVASVAARPGSITHVDPNGARTRYDGDLLGAKAAVARRGGTIEIA